MDKSARNCDHDTSGSSDANPTVRKASKRSRSNLFCNHCGEWVSKSTFYRHRAKRSEHPETVSDSSNSESSTEDSNLDEGICAHKYISACDDDPQGNQSVPQPSTDDSSCTEPSDDSESSSESVQDQVRVCNSHMHHFV